MSKLITMIELSELKRNAVDAYDQAQGDEKVETFGDRIVKGNRYLSSLRDLDPQPQDKIDAAVDRLKGIMKERDEFLRTYSLPRAVYGLLYELASQSTVLGLTRCVPGEAAGLHNALQIRMEDLGIDLLLDLSYDGVPF